MTANSGTMSISGKHVFVFVALCFYVWLLEANGRKGKSVGPSLLNEKLRWRKSVHNEQGQRVRLLAINSEREEAREVTWSWEPTCGIPTVVLWALLSKSLCLFPPKEQEPQGIRCWGQGGGRGRGGKSSFKHQHSLCWKPVKTPHSELPVLLPVHLKNSWLASTTNLED